jgi:hypothetical protein
MKPETMTITDLTDIAVLIDDTGKRASSPETAETLEMLAALRHINRAGLRSLLAVEVR